ncbi:class C beta-lactamase-related serine hydrolase [candidate division KSB1 bacterium]|nr:MAG: class C beta-lactamase-related serine hydrolase [candidate division KSB1 bacterium]
MKHYIFLLVAALFLHCQKDLTSPESASYVWPLASPESQGLNPEQLEAAFSTAGRQPFIHAIVVTRNGHLIAERYYNNTDKDDAHTVRSVSKSFLSALYGIALDAGHIATLDTPMVAYLPDYASAIRDERIFDITLRHLLTMRSGYNGDSDILLAMTSSADWLWTALGMQLIFVPGTGYRYSTVGTHLLSVVLSRATGVPAHDYAEKHLFEPLGITLRDWAQDPQGYAFGGNDMFITPRDMARFGWLYLNNGNLDGRQIVPAAWIAASIAPTYTYTNPTWGAINDIAYSHLWWLGEMKSFKIYFALGYGGQFIFNIPELNMVITTACDSQFMDWDAADAQERVVTEIVANGILAALKK